MGNKIYAYTSRIFYNMRNQLNFLNASVLLAGFQQDRPFIGTVTTIGTHFTDLHSATGLAMNLARPLFREFHRNDMSEEEAVWLITEALIVCHIRDGLNIRRFTIAKVTRGG